jgi:Uma2 family endonuclease
VLSPRTKVKDRIEKLPIYAAAGVQYAWLVNPYYRSVEIFRLHEGNWLLRATHVGNATVRAEPFDAIELDLSGVFRDLPRAPRASEGDLYDQWAEIL